MASDAERPAEPPPVELRVVTPDDWRLWQLIRLEALAEAPYAFGSRLEDWQRADESRWRERIGLESSHNVVALREGRPVGMASGVPGDQPGTAELISMYVGHELRGTGLAAQLVAAVAHWAAGVGADFLCLDVHADNGQARTFYERQGFEVTGTVDRSSAAEPLELRMCRALGGGRAPAQDQ